MINSAMAKKTGKNKLLRSRSLERHKRRRLRRRKTKYTRLRNSKKIDSIGYTKARRSSRCNSLTFKLPEEFTFLSNTIEVIQKFRSIEAELAHRNDVSRIKFDMSDIRSIDIGAITYLLAFGIRRIEKYSNRCSFRLPEDEKAKRIISESGFQDYLRSSAQDKAEVHGKILLARGSNQVTQEIIGNTITKGLEQLYDPNDENIAQTRRKVYTVVTELCNNSVEHANRVEANKNWLLTVHPNREERKLECCFLDLGLGIFGTLRRKAGQKFEDQLRRKKQDEIILDTFKGKYDSSTGDINRNKGLPTVYKIAMEGHINNLHLITNKTYLPFEIEGSTLSKEFNGTFYYFDVPYKENK